MKKMSELSGAELSAWQADYPHRQEVRAKMGRSIIGRYRAAARMPETERLDVINSITQQAIQEGAVAAAIPGILIKEFKWAAAANLGSEGENTDISVDILDPASVSTPEQVEEWGNAFRLHPLLRERYLAEMAAGQRVMFVAKDENQEPAGRAFIIFGGPHSNQSEGTTDEDEFAGRPSEPEVKAIIGENAAWGEDLVVMEGYRGGGVGTRLILEIEQYLKNKPDTDNAFYFAVQPGNKTARHVYERMGYAQLPVGGEETFISHIEGTGRPVILMGKEL